MSTVKFEEILKKVFEELKADNEIELVCEYRFALKRFKRWFAADYAELRYGILIEYEGLQVKGARSRHTTVEGYSKDCTKYNLGTTMGFMWLRYTRNHLDEDQIRDDITKAISTRKYSEGKGKCSNCNEILFMPTRILSDMVCLLCEYKDEQKNKKVSKNKATRSPKVVDEKKKQKKEKPTSTRRPREKRSVSKQEELIRKVIEQRNSLLLDDLFYASPKDK